MRRCTEPAQALGLPDPSTQADLLLLEMEPGTLPHTLDKGSTKPTFNHGVGVLQHSQAPCCLLSYPMIIGCHCSQIPTNRRYRYLTHPGHQKRGWAGFRLRSQRWQQCEKKPTEPFLGCVPHSLCSTGTALFSSLKPESGSPFISTTFLRKRKWAWGSCTELRGVWL